MKTKREKRLEKINSLLKQLKSEKKLNKEEVNGVKNAIELALGMGDKLASIINNNMDKTEKKEFKKATESNEEMFLLSTIDELREKLNRK